MTSSTTEMPHQPIAFIGGGNMASAIIGGLLRQGLPAAQIEVVEPLAQARDKLKDQFGIVAQEHASVALARAVLVVWAVKPQTFKQAATQARAHIGAALHLSVAAGIRSGSIAQWLGTQRIVRSMPNTPALLGAGAAGLYANKKVDAKQRATAQALMEAVGKALWIEDESLMDAVTAVSGSGPAYFFLLMECMETAARELGLPAEAARALTLQTAFGAARMALESGEAPEVLRKQVTSPKGTTAAAVGVFEDGKFAALVQKALTAARDRGRQLSAEASEDGA